MRVGVRGWAVLALLVIAGLAYWPALRGGFIWDDDDHLTENPAMSAPDGLRQIWTSRMVSRYYPLTLTTLWLERQAWGLRPLPFHALNIAIHAVNAVLLYLLLMKLRVPGAWVGAAFWAVHPVNVETVAWITELKNTQSALFFFFCLLCYLRFESDGKRVWYAAALVCAAAALLSKPSVVMLPTILLLVIWWERRRVTVPDLWRVAPVLAMSLGMSLLTIAEQRAHVIGAGAAEWQLGFIQRCLIAGKATWFYALKLLWPGNLMFVYPRWNVRVFSIADWLPLLGVIVVGFAVWFRRQQQGARAGLFAFGCFLQALFPVLGFFDVYYFRFSFVADHFNYLGSAVLLPFVAAAGARVVSSRPGRIAVASAVLLVLWALCWQRSLVFRDDERLWLDTLSKNPAAGLAHNNLGTICRRRGDLAAAASHWREASRLLPGLWQPYVNLGKLQLDAGQIDEAARLFQQTLRVKPDSVEARYGLASVEMRRGNDTDTLEYLQQALQTRPEDARAHVLAGRIQEHQGDPNQALEQYLLAVRLDPENAEAFLQLGFLRRQQGDRERAIHCFRRVLTIQPGNPEARQALVELGAPPSD